MRAIRTFNIEEVTTTLRTINKGDIIQSDDDTFIQHAGQFEPASKRQRGGK